MKQSIYIVRDRMKQLLREEEKLARALRGTLPPKKLRFSERHYRPSRINWLEFYFEYFMTYHVNNFRISDKLWCDGAIIDSVRKANNKFYLTGELYLLPEGDETPYKYKPIERWDAFPFSGNIELVPHKDKVKFYKIDTSIGDFKVSCLRRI